MNPTSTSDTITAEVTINASADRIFNALANSEERMKWWGRGGWFKTARMESDLRPGGEWLMVFETDRGPTSIRGQYQIIEPPHVLAFTWIPDWYEAQQTLVRFDLEEHDGVTTVRLTHSGLGEADRANHRGWPAILETLKRHMEPAAG